jgi:predicted metalloprotease with PDZ domain
VEEEHHWIEEGLATYVEPVARVRAGELSAARVWGDMVEGMPKGEPGPGDRGLDRTPTWGRTYWGGALFCLVADVRIREATGNRVGLETALRGVLRAGGSIRVEWPLTRVLDVGDQAVGVAILRPLYEQMHLDPVRIDLDTLWRRLGVDRGGGGVTLDDAAPLAAVRRSIMAP